jgi:hypothetical protein
MGYVFSMVCDVCGKSKEVPATTLSDVAALVGELLLRLKAAEDMDDRPIELKCPACSETGPRPGNTMVDGFGNIIKRDRGH